MNAARRARKWGDARADPVLMAEALADEIDDPASGLVSRDFLRAELTDLAGRLNARIAQLETRMVELETRLLWRLITVFGIQIALVGVLVAALVQVLR